MNTLKVESYKLANNAAKVLLDSINILSKRLSKQEVEIVSAIFKRNIDAGIFDPDKQLWFIPEMLSDILRYMFEHTNSTANEFIAVALFPCTKHGDLKINEIIRCFDDEVAVMVNGFISTSNLYADNRDLEDENFFKLTLTFAKDIRVIYFNLIVRLIFMRHIRKYKRSFQRRIVDETAKVYIAFAYKLGFTEIKSELEDLCFKYYNPKAYEDIERALMRTKNVHDKYIENFIQSIQERLEKAGIKYTVKGRIKTIYSIYQKMIDTNVPFDKVYDLFAIRIIVDIDQEQERNVCWQIYALVTQLYKVNESLTKDWITAPKENGYESLHVTVLGANDHWVEVQIRSKRMDEVAEHGVAAHWKYKRIQKLDRVDSLLISLNKALRNRSCIEYDELKDMLYVDLFDSELFIFSPSGELYKMPYGSTVLDFAFALGEEKGEYCLSGRVNGRLVSLRYKLNNGDKVDIITSSNPTLSPSWLKYVVTRKARVLITEKLNMDFTCHTDTQNIEKTLPATKPIKGKTIPQVEMYLKVVADNTLEIFMDIVQQIYKTPGIALKSINVDTSETSFCGDIIIVSESRKLLEMFFNRFSRICNIKKIEKQIG